MDSRKQVRLKYNIYKSNNISPHTCKAYSITNEQFTGLLLDITQNSELIDSKFAIFPLTLLPPNYQYTRRISHTRKHFT